MRSLAYMRLSKVSRAARPSVSASLLGSLAAHHASAQPRSRVAPLATAAAPGAPLATVPPSCACAPVG
eukprot:scaffold431_cov315-Prasinococcus_capsulatus_cf.AAC.4